MSHTDEPRTSATLLGQLADSRNEEAWRLFLDRYKPLIEGWCVRWGLSRDQAEEVTATVLLKLAKAMKSFRYDAEQGSFRGWLKTVVHHAVEDLRRAIIRSPGDRGTGDSHVQEMLQQIEAPESIDNLVQELDTQMEHDRQLARQAQVLVQQRVEPHTWKAFWLTAIENRPGAEVAAELGMMVTAVHMAKCRVSKMLREEVAQLERSGPELKRGPP